MLRINLCSGQRPFDKKSWINVDVNPRWEPDVVASGDHMPMFADNSADVIVVHHGLEHFGLGEANPMLQECYRILKKGGSLIVTVPDLRALAEAWIAGKIDDYIYCVNLFGAYMDSDVDRHKFGFHWPTLKSTLQSASAWSSVIKFDFRKIPEADIAADWWILGAEAVK